MHLTTEPKKNIKWKLAELKGKIGNWPIIVGDFNFPHSIMGRTTRQKTDKEIKDWTTI